MSPPQLSAQMSEFLKQDTGAPSLQILNQFTQSNLRFVGNEHMDMIGSYLTCYDMNLLLSTNLS